MRKGQKTYQAVWLLSAFMLMMLTGCSNHDELTSSQAESVTVEMAYALNPTVQTVTTRQAGTVIGNNTPYRGPENFRLIPMIGDVTTLAEVTWQGPVDKTSPQSKFYYSSYCNLPIGVNRCLVYGKPADITETGGVDTQVYNGAINEPFPIFMANAGDLEDIEFSPVPIYNTVDINNENNLVIPTDASTLADYLTEVANTEGWSNSDITAILELRQKFINRGNDLPGSAASVKALLKALATEAEYLNSFYSISLLANIKNAATAKANAITSTVTYPRSINLPDGAAALRWVESENAFKPQMYTTTLDDINTVSRFAYPASLYYFVNSGINTSTEVVDYEAIYANAYTTTDPDKTAWSYVLDNFTAGPTVEGTTRSVALTNPVQYAVGQLQVNVQASSATLKDNDDHDVDLGTNNFPLKGIIVGGQRPVDYEFKQTENTDTKVKFLYDSQVETCTLSTSSQLGCQTLVLQSYDGEDVDIVLEFENNNDNLTFTGVNGCRVYPHTRFYLVGKILAKLEGNIVDDKDKRVFTKDYITTVNLKVTSLKKAYNLLPSLLTGHLELGIEVSDWMAATPDVVILK